MIEGEESEPYKCAGRTIKNPNRKGPAGTKGLGAKLKNQENGEMQGEARMDC